MLVDDEAAVREMSSRTLKAFGYEVLTAEDGTDAVALFAQHKGRVAVVIVDMMMPFMDGIMTARALRRLDPMVRLIGSSGLVGRDRLPEAQEAGFGRFLPKPYTADQLLEALARELAVKPA
jgi:CheY-like chemotaxis protein